MLIAMPYRQEELIDWDQADIFAIYQVENNQVVDRELVQLSDDRSTWVELLYRRLVNRLILPSLPAELKFDLDYYQMRYSVASTGLADQVLADFLNGDLSDDD